MHVQQQRHPTHSRRSPVLVPFCPVSPSLSWFQVGIPAFSQCRKIQHVLFRHPLFRSKLDACRFVLVIYDCFEVLKFVFECSYSPNLLNATELDDWKCNWKIGTKYFTFFMYYVYSETTNIKLRHQNHSKYVEQSIDRLYVQGVPSITGQSVFHGLFQTLHSLLCGRQIFPTCKVNECPE